MKVLSLFNGMGCAWLALEECGIKVGIRYSSEIEKYPNQANDALYPDTIQLGDVRKVDVSQLEKIDLLCGGSPCQSFSFAGKRKGMATKCEIEILSLNHYLELKQQNFEFEGQSYLFWEYIRILTEIRQYNPEVKFLLENVIMGSKWQKVITQAIGINPIRINADLVSAQNRNRLFWTNIFTEQQGLFGDLKCMIPQPKDEGILLKDVLETDVPDKYFLSGKMLDYLNTRKANYNSGKINYKTESDVASCLNASVGLDISDNIIIDTNRKARCFTAGGNSGGLHSQMDLIQCVAMRGRNPDNPKSRVSVLETQQQLEPRFDGKTNCITSVQKDNLVMQINPSKESGGVQPYQQNRIYDCEGIMPALNAQLGGRNNVLTKNETIRRLTPRECGRLQSVPEDKLEILLNCGISDTQIYKMFGNGWNIKVISHIFSFMK